ncbi:beta-N-acetylhexosaminidase [Edaphobacter sp.]|uniref:beta-N-acetylhexosaminidase n=1 Tax=Edaphobacter sp. TaxID=1934404 RepID=UPI002DB9723F|nr:family 20 glycosylhydrolase [Edaphobacter sp.]HEU5340788.1 family 20 glycosylhydrolase [Edaphobacter sp.]
MTNVAAHAASCTNVAFVNTLMPQPAKIATAPGCLTLDNTFSVSIAAYRDARLDAATERMLNRLSRLAAVPHHLAIQSGTSADLVIDVKGQGSVVPSLDDDESYVLNVTNDHARLEANTVVGAMRGMETFLQLVQANGGSGFAVPGVEIHDQPRFRWRGLMIDTGRHFEPVSVIERTLDGMAAVKLNVFHWHLTEDQGFRIESRRFPKLTGMGSDGLYYTQEQAREVIAYAAARGIRVVPEFDMPGHTTSWLVGYPELGSAPGPYEVQRTFGVHDAAFDPTRESTYKFLDEFIEEMADLFPDAYMHLGGDESNGKQWRANPEIERFMKEHNIATTQALQTYFSQRVEKLLEQHHKHMVGWDEVLQPNLPKDVVVQSWRGTHYLADAARQGNQGILSAPYYLDHMDSAAQVYLADPLPGGEQLTAEQANLVLGGELCMWGEHVVPRTIDSRIWPRAAAIAERFWSPASVNDVNDMYRRLGVMSLRLEAVGLTHISGPEAGLRQLAGSEDDGALRTLASVVQPVDFGQRYREQRTSQLTPMNLLVDSVRPDPPMRHELEMLVEGFLADSSHKKNRDELMAIFHQWVAAGPGLEAIANRSPLLADARPRAAELSVLGRMGLDAVSSLSAGKRRPAGWASRSLETLTRDKNHNGLVDFVVLGPLEKLVGAAGKVR